MMHIRKKFKNIFITVIVFIFAPSLIIFTSCDTSSDNSSTISDSSYSSTDIDSSENSDDISYNSSTEDVSIDDSSINDSSMDESSTDDSSADENNPADGSSVDSSVVDSSLDDSSSIDSSVEESSAADSSTDDSSTEYSSADDSSSSDSTSGSSVNDSSSAGSSDTGSSTEDVHIHQYSEWQVITEATCTEDGLKCMVCDGCGDTIYDTIDKLGHDYAATTVVATVDNEGYTEHTCTRCGDSYTDNVTDYLYTKELTFKKSDDATYYIVTGISDSPDVTDIYIPSFYNGLTVKEIGENAFKNNTTIVNITIGSTIEKIGDNAFYECSALTKINIPGSLTALGTNCFCRCSKLSEIYYEAVNLNDIGADAFAQVGSGAKLTLYISGNVKNIPQDLFNITSSGFRMYINSIIFDENCYAEIGNNAFYNVLNIETIVLAAHITTANTYALGDTTNAYIYFIGTQEQWEESSLYGKTCKDVYFYSEASADGCWYYDIDGNITLW